MNNKGGKYTKLFHCYNCGMDFFHLFDFGTIAHKPSCPNCGVSEKDRQDDIQTVSKESTL